jgi:hypothetical protein
MTRQGLSAAHALGTKLPRFRTAAEARRALLEQRDRSLAELRGLDATDSDFVMDSTPASLVALEQWYFALAARRGFARLGTERARFEVAMGFYFGTVAVRHAKARWIVEEFAFKPGTYELGIAHGKLFSLMGIEALCKDWHKRPGNKAHRALSREYAQYFAPAPRRASKPKPADQAIEAEVLRILGRKTRPSRYPWQLAEEIRDKLGVTRAKLPKDQVVRVLSAMEKRKRVVRIEHGGTGHYSVSFRLAGRA